MVEHAQGARSPVDYPAALRDSIAADLQDRDTPSRRDGYPGEVEASCRISACFFIHDAAAHNLPAVPIWVISTAQLYMQQYYDRHSLKTSDRIFICIASLFLACKVWDTPRSLDNLVKSSWQLICLQLDGQLIGPSHKSMSPEDKERESNRIRDDVFFMQLIHASLTAERAVMYALNFDLPKYEVHDKLLRLHRHGALGAQFCASDDGHDLFKVAFDSVQHAMYGQVYFLYNQDEIAWGHIMFAARTMGMTERMFKDPPYCLHPWWMDQKNPTISFSHEKIDDLVERIAAVFIANFPEPGSTEHSKATLSPAPGTLPGSPPFSAGSPVDTTHSGWK